MKCARSLCRRKQFLSGLCKPHWAAEDDTGLTDSAPSRAHVQKLQQLQWSHEGIACAAGISRCSIRNLLASSRVRRSTEQAIMAIPLVLFQSTFVRVPTVGLRRRYEALVRIGWPLSTSAAMAGTSPGTFLTLLKRGDCSVVYLKRYNAVYVELAGTQGPSELCVRRGIRMGFQPPMAWELADIDDPKARPFQGFREAA